MATLGGTERPAHALIRALGWLGQASNAISVAVIWLLALVMTYDVVLRGLGVAQLWASEVSVYMMLALAFLGAGATLSADGHFRVTFIRALCPGWMRFAMDIFAVLLTLVIALGMCWGAWTVVQFSLMLNLTTSTLLRVPLYLLYGQILLGCVLLAIAALREVILVLARGAAHRDLSGESEVV